MKGKAISDKLNYYALLICILSDYEKGLSVNKALKAMGIYPRKAQQLN